MADVLAVRDEYRAQGWAMLISCFVGFVSGLNRWRREFSNNLSLKFIFFYCIIREKGGVEMYIDTNTIISVSEANQSFSRAARIADEYGQVVLFKNNRPRYLLIDLEKSPIIEMTDDEKIDFVAARILKKYKDAFIELAK